MGTTVSHLVLRVDTPPSMTPELKTQFAEMSERFMGADSVEQRKRFDIRVLRHNNPIFGPKTVTVEYVPKEKTKTFARMEEDVNEDALPLATRIYDSDGKEAANIKVTKHHKSAGIPVVDTMEAVGRTNAGEIRSRTACSSVEVECDQ